MLTLTIDDVGELTIFRCAGRIVAGDTDLLRHAVLTQPRMRTAVLDFAEVSVVDAAGLGMLVSLLKWAQATGAELKLLNVPPRVERLLELTRLKSLFEVCSLRELMNVWCCSLSQDPFARSPIDRLQEGVQSPPALMRSQSISAPGELQHGF